MKSVKLLIKEYRYPIKNKFRSMLSLLILLAFFSNKSDGQINYLGGWRFVCPGSEVEYWLPALNEGCSYDHIRWHPTNGTITDIGAESVTIRWNSDIVTGQLDVSFLIEGGDCGVSGSLTPLDVEGIYLTGVKITSIGLGPRSVLDIIPVTAELEGSASRAYTNPAIKWSILDIAGNTIVPSNKLPTGPSINIDLSDFITDIEDFIGENMQIKAEYSVCGKTPLPDATLFTPTFPAPTAISYQTTPPSCSCCGDGKITINSVTYKGETYNSTKPIPANLPAMNFTIDAGYGSINFPNSTRIFPIEFNDSHGDIVSSNNWEITAAPVLNGVEGEQYSKENVVVDASTNTYYVTLTTTPPACHNGTGALTANVFNGSEDYSYHFTGPGDYDVTQASKTITNISTEGDYTVEVTDNVNIACNNPKISATKNLQFPAEISISNVSHQDITCNGVNNGSITFNFIGEQSRIVFEPFNTARKTPTITDETDYFTVTYSGLAPGSYTIEHVDECTSSPTVQILDRPQLNMTSHIATDPTLCYNGSISVTAIGGQRGANATFTLQKEQDNGDWAPHGVAQSIPTRSTNYNVSFPSSLPGNLPSGNYRVIASDNCSTQNVIEGPITLLPIAHPTNISTSKTDASCIGQNGQFILNGFDYNGVPYNSSSNLSNFTFIFNGTSQGTNHPFEYNVGAGDHTLEIVRNNCSGFGSQTIIEPSQVELTNQDPKNSCLDKPNGSITISSVNGNTSSNNRYYTISPDPNGIGVITTPADGVNAEFINLPAGTYTITVDDHCPSTNEDQLTIPIGNYNQIQSLITAIPIVCNDESSGQLLVSAFNSQAPYTFTLLPGSTAPVSNVSENTPYPFQGLNHTTAYQIQINDDYGCTEIFDAPLISNPPPLQITSDQTNVTPVTCWDGSNGQIEVNATGGTDDIYFAIYDNNDSDNNDSTDYALNYTHTFSTLKAGTKTIKVTDINKCFVEKDFIVKQPNKYEVSSLSTDSTQCHGGHDGSLSIIATGGTPNGGQYTYNLMKVNSDLITSSQVESKTGDAVSFANLSFGQHYVKILDSSLCLLVSDTIELSQPEEMLITKNMSAISCYSTTDITLSADITGGTEPYSYTWKDEHKNFYSSASSIKVDKGNYFLFVMDAHNCGYGKTAPDLEQPFSVDYTVDKPDTIKVTIDNLQNVDYNGLSNGSITLSSSGGWSFHQYSMDGGEYQNLPEFTRLEIGPHTFRVKDGSNCENSITATITQPDSFLVNLKSIKDVNCFEGADGQITIHAQGGISPYNFVLDDGQGNVIEQNDSVFVGLPAGNYSASVGYHTYNQLVNNIAIGQPSSALSSDITAYQSPKCTFSDGWATVTANGGTSPYTYSWSDQQTASTATTLHSGDYYVVTSDFNNCTDTSTITLYDIAGPELSIGQINDLPCSNSDNVGSITLSVSGGTVPYNVQWNDPDHQTGLTASGLASGTYSATVTDFDGCISKSEDILITRPTELIINFDGFKDPACFGETNGEITASAAGGTPPYQFVWQGIGNAGNTGIISGLPAGVYDLNLTDAHNCVTQGNFELKNPDEIVINLPDSVFICAGQTATLDAGNLGSFYQWTADNGFSSDKQIVNLPEQGDYSVTVSNVEGCSNSKKVHLKYENRQFDAAFLLASQATMADTVVLIEISWPVPDSLEWNITDDFLRLVDGGAYKELIPLETGEYTVGMRAWLAGCEDIVEKTITIVPADGQKELKVAKVDLIQSAKLFPNPNTGNFEVEVKLAYEADVRADLFSIKGLRIIPTKYDSGKKDYLIGFNLMRLEPGVYFVNVSAGDEVRKLKFVVN